MDEAYAGGMFVDEVRVHVRGGKGGSGVTSFQRQPYEPRGRPNGGDGGAGGDVVVRANRDVATLVDLHHRPHRKAGNGANGEGDLRTGADGDDVVLPVPVGTVVRLDDGTPVADLAREGDAAVVAAGGRGGRGNAAFRTGRRRAPRFHELGEPGQERWVRLELKLLADVALVGFPNAGKSSLIARLSAARPKIADYAFTTLSPNLGVVVVDDVDFVVADVPGLIEGASEGRGLGHRFLRHVERALVLVHVLDCASHDQRDPREDLATVLAELERYGEEVMDPAPVPLVDRPALVALTKVDADRDTAEIVAPDLEADGWEVLLVSAVTGEGLDRLRRRLAALVVAARAEQGAHELPAARPVLRPAAGRGRNDFTVEPVTTDGEAGWRVRGERVERWVVMTDLANPDGVRYLQGRLVRAGVEKALAAAGALPGDPVEIAGAVFDFAPDPGPDEDEDEDEDADNDLAEGDEAEGAAVWT